MKYLKFILIIPWFAAIFASIGFGSYFLLEEGRQIGIPFLQGLEKANWFFRIVSVLLTYSALYLFFHPKFRVKVTVGSLNEADGKSEGSD